MTDETMRSLLAVHRDELDQRDKQIENLEYKNLSLEGKCNQAERQAETHLKSADMLRQSVNNLQQKIAKLEDINTSLKIELADAREAATTARDAAES